MSLQFFNEPDDCDWLASTHLKKFKDDGTLVEFQAFTLEGNEDCPERIVTYTNPNPLITDIGAVYRYVEGQYVSSL